MMAAILVKNGRVIDPAGHTDRMGDLYIENGVIADLPQRLPEHTTMIDAQGKIVAPGFIDLHVHLREPGKEEAETIETGSRAAAAGGFTTIVAMPNTTPPLDTPEILAWVLDAGQRRHHIRVLASACLSVQRKGLSCADLQALAAGGAVAFTDDGSTVHSREVMEQAMRQAAALDLPIMDHAEDPLAEHHGVVHQGQHAERTGLPGIPSDVEISIVKRDIDLARETGARIHIQHVSTKEAVDLIRAANKDGLPISGEATPHHLALCDEDVDPTDSRYKMNPPLRSRADRDAIRAAVADNTLQAFATDHAPHTAASKQTGFLTAPFGIIGLETAVGITYTVMVDTGVMDIASWIARWTTGPAAILGLPAPALTPGSPADIVVLDVTTPWTVNPSLFISKSSNTPFGGMALKGRALTTISRGTIVYPLQKDE
ncbi:MAG: dihydroorotase [Spartobacteria bacterium]|nr:dihydroorotase [Spartobacteria bacterium]